LSEPAKAITIYVDADACPVKAEIYRVAERERYAIKVYVVSNSPLAIPRSPLIERIVVGSNRRHNSSPGLRECPFHMDR
jgi:uncharacterized protein